MKRLLIASVLLTVFVLNSCNTIPKSNEGTKVEITTDYGKIILKLYDETPLHRDNFIKLIKKERPFAVFSGNDHVGIQRITESSL